MVNARAAERLGGLASVTPMANGPHVRRVVRAGGGSDGGIFEQAFLDRKLLIHVGGHEHDIHKALVHDLADDIEKFGKISVAVFLAVPDFRRELRWARTAPGKI